MDTNKSDDSDGCVGCFLGLLLLSILIALISGCPGRSNTNSETPSVTGHESAMEPPSVVRYAQGTESAPHRVNQLPAVDCLRILPSHEVYIEMHDSGVEIVGAQKVSSVGYIFPYRRAVTFKKPLVKARQSRISSSDLAKRFPELKLMPPRGYSSDPDWSDYLSDPAATTSWQSAFSQSTDWTVELIEVNSSEAVFKALWQKMSLQQAPDPRNLDAYGLRLSSTDPYDLSTDRYNSTAHAKALLDTIKNARYEVDERIWRVSRYGQTLFEMSR